MENQYQNSTKLLAVMALLMATLIWGGSFVVTKNSVDVLTPSFLLALRFAAAAAAMILLFHKKLCKIDLAVVKCGVLLGVFQGAAYQLQTYGIKYTTASKNAFITSLYVILVPVFTWALHKKKPTIMNAAAGVIAVIGLALLSLDGDSGVNIGDVLTMLGSICCAFQLVYIERFTREHDPILLTLIQIVVTAIINGVMVYVFDGTEGYNFAALADKTMLIGLLYLSFFCTTVAFVLQNVGQKYLSANTASLLLSTESVFGAACAVIFLKEELSEKMILGCGLMFLAIIISEIHFKK